MSMFLYPLSRDIDALLKHAHEKDPMSIFGNLGFPAPKQRFCVHVMFLVRL